MRVVLRDDKTPAAPEACGFIINGIDHQRPSADQGGGINAAAQGMFHETCANATSGPLQIRRQLSEKQAGNRVRRLARPDRARECRRHHGGWREAVISNNPSVLMNHHHGGEALLLIGKGPRLQPAVKRGLATGESGHIMRGRKRLGCRQ